jgi:hypothetical protein
MQPFPKWVAVCAVALAAAASIGYDQLAVVFGSWVAHAIPVVATIVAAVSHSLNGTGGK